MDAQVVEGVQIAGVEPRDLEYHSALYWRYGGGAPSGGIDIWAWTFAWTGGSASVYRQNLSSQTSAIGHIAGMLSTGSCTGPVVAAVDLCTAHESGPAVSFISGWCHV